MSRNSILFIFLALLLVASYQNCGASYKAGDLIELAYDRQPVQILSEKVSPELNAVCVVDRANNLVIGQFLENAEPSVVCMSYDACFFLTERSPTAFGPLFDERCKNVAENNFHALTDDEILGDLENFRSLLGKRYPSGTKER